jgi:hypothetical protein
MTLGDLAAALDGAGWPGRAELDIVTVLGGKIPVRWEPDDTVAVLHTAGPAAVYLRVEGSVGRDELAAALAGSGPAAAARVLEIGYEPPLRS